MKKTPTTESSAPSPMGENTILTLTIPKSLHEPKYKEILAKTSLHVTIPGFRKGKAPTKLVEEQIGQTNILDKVLEEILPAIYAQAVDTAGIDPLVPPQVKIVSIRPKEDWTVEAHTAVAPKVKLGDWKKIVKDAAKQHEKDSKEHEGHDHAKEMSESDKDQALLSALFSALIKDTNPAIPPLLLEKEARRQIEELARTLASHRIELDQFLKSTGKTVETLQQEYTMSSLANLQVEFTIQAITAELKLDATDDEVTEVLGKKISEFPKESQKRIHEQAIEVAKRKKTLKILTDTAQK